MDAPANEDGVVAGAKIVEALKKFAAEPSTKGRTDVKPAATGDAASTRVATNAVSEVAGSAAPRAADSSAEAKNAVKAPASTDAAASVDSTPLAAESSAKAKIDDKLAAPGGSNTAKTPANVDAKTAKSETSLASDSSSSAKTGAKPAAQGGSIRYVKLPPGWEGLSIKLSGNRCVISEVPKACFSSGALVEKGAIKNQVEGVEVGDEVVSFNGESPIRLLEKISTKGDAWNACSTAKPPHEVGSKTKFDSPPCAACDFIRRRKQLGFDVALQMWLRSVKREISFTLGVRPASEIPVEEESAPSLNATPEEAAQPVKRLKSLASLDDCIEGEKKSTVVALQASSESTNRMEKALERLKMLSDLDDKTRDKKYKQASKGKGKGKDDGKSKGKRPTGPYLARTRLTEELVTGEVTDWRGKFGWIKPHKPIDHPKANVHKGKLYVHKVDLEWWVDSLTVGSFCRFHVYSDANSLGAEECTELKEASGSSEDWSDWKDSDWKHSGWSGGDQNEESKKRKR